MSSRAAFELPQSNVNVRSATSDGLQRQLYGLAGREDLEKGERIFGSEAGGFIVALSRWLPVMPEVVACMAGMSQMPFGRFLVALACGSVPLGFAFAGIGSVVVQLCAVGSLVTPMRIAVARRAYTVS